MSKTLIFYVSGMTCGGCSSSIKRIVTNKLAEESIELISFDVDLLQFKDPKKTTMVISNTPEEIQLLDQAQTSTERAQREEQLRHTSWEKIRTYIEDLAFTSKDYDYIPENEQPVLLP